ncbi:MAG: hybrid sensor histidine kinase/response regulator [Calditrichaeota bacterium]|nr:MAG: hybrid sensor histidine kinase/response regulator [Calditrichota bacterium]
MQQGQQPPSSPVIDALNAALSLLQKQIAAADRSEAAPPPEEIRRTLQRLKAPEAPATGEVPANPPGPPAGPNGASGAAPASPASPKPPEKEKEKPAGRKASGSAQSSGRKSSGRTTRVSAEKLDAILFQSEEMLAARLNAEQQAAEIQEILLQMDLWRKEWDRVRSQVQRLRQKRPPGNHSGEEASNHHWRKIGDFLERNEAFLNRIHQRLRELARASRSDFHTLQGMVDRLLEDTQKILMLPFSTLTQIFPRLVRDISRSLGKEAELIIQGSEVEMDKRILEELKDPLIHLLRNCLDHGLETPEVRQQRGKPPRGTITVAISQLDGGKVELLISDDGNGIDVEKVKQAAVRAGTLTEQEAAEMEDRETLMLIFRSQVSTSPIITELSGRGLGMSIVQEKVEALGGSISVETEPGAYTRFRIILPLTLARFRGVLVEVAGQLFVVPSGHVERVLRVFPSQIKTVEHRETITVNGRVLPLVPLAEILELPPHPVDSPEACRPVLVLTSGSTAIAFTVDRILNEQEVLVKSLGRQLLRVRNIGGATVLGSGKAVPILNPLDVLRSAMALSKSGPSRSSAEMERPRRKRLLVAEDSITTRTLLKHILETAGYEVETAVDGAEALARLKEEHFDALVSDIEMPRMDGFELTAEVRRDARLRELPVVLVTSRSAPEDRERGVEVGADAYIVKSDFDQSNLLQVIEGLL